jgi:hypothetical protein
MMATMDGDGKCLCKAAQSEKLSIARESLSALTTGLPQ